MSQDADGPARLASLVRGYRQAAGWTQQQLASRSGLSVGAVRDVEQGRTGRPRPASVRRLADCLDLDQARRGELLAALPHAPGTDGSPAPVTWPCRDGQPAAGPAWPPGTDATGVDPGGLGAASQQIRVAVLGPLAASRGGAALRLGPDRQRAVLGLLALEPGVPLHRDAIIDALWGAWAPDSAAAMVQCYVSRLRRILHGGPPRAGVLSGTGHGYLLEAGHSLDLPRFRQAAQQARAALTDGDPTAACAHCEQGLAWWRGDPLADIGLLREHPAVQLLRQQRAAIIVDYAQAACAAGEPGRALPALGQLAAAEPLDERVHARLMIALACTGRQAAALSLYQGLATRLDRELGVRPGPELATAHDQVLRQDLPGAARARPAPAVMAPSVSPDYPASPHSPAPVVLGSPVAVLVPRQLPAPVPLLAGRAA
jgi:DNA-binding SARP family transcriptional activator/DNA-binding XRE family transcriptional regulator